MDQLLKKIAPVEVIYYLNNQELSRRTSNARELKRSGFGPESFAIMLRERGLTAAGDLQNERLPNEGRKFVIPVVDDQGQNSTFSVVACPKRRR